MADRTTNFKGEPLKLLGQELKVGDALPQLKLVGVDMGEFGNETLGGKKAIVCTVPSLDTPVCSVETKRFNQEVDSLADQVSLLTISRDLPFAQNRWCGAEGAKSVVMGSDYRHRVAGEALGTLIEDWQLLSRAVFVVDSAGKICHVEYVSEISEEPNYEAALEALKAAS